jgi:hypothetical protein
MHILVFDHNATNLVAKKAPIYGAIFHEHFQDVSLHFGAVT